MKITFLCCGLVPFKAASLWLKLNGMTHECSRFRLGKHWPHLILLCFTSGSNRDSGVAVLRSWAECRVRTLPFCCTQASSDFSAVTGTHVQGKFVAPHWGDGGYPFHLSFPPGHMFSILLHTSSAEWSSVLNYPKAHHQQWLLPISM